MTTTYGEIRQASTEAEALAIKLIEANPDVRRVFMETLVEKIGDKFCRECWIEDHGCQCWNDE